MVKDIPNLLINFSIIISCTLLCKCSVILDDAIDVMSLGNRGGSPAEKIDNLNKNIWKSKDFENWETIKNIKGYRPGTFQLPLVFNEKMIIIGGFNKVVQSSFYTNDNFITQISNNGKDWEILCNDTSGIYSFYSTMDISAIAFDNKLWHKGPGKFTYSSDGNFWNDVELNGIEYLGRLINFKNQLFSFDYWNEIIHSSNDGFNWKIHFNGFPKDTLSSYTKNITIDLFDHLLSISSYGYYNDQNGGYDSSSSEIFLSDDGKSWISVMRGHEMLSDNRWITGICKSNVELFFEISHRNGSREFWKTKDGRKWERIVTSSFPELQYYSMVYFKNEFYIIGGVYNNY